jgi:deoxyribonuclease V
MQRWLARQAPPLWSPTLPFTAAGCFVCFARGPRGPGRPGDQGWAAAVLVEEGRLLASALVKGAAGAGYAAGLLALREGPLLEAALRGLPRLPDVVLVNATGRDHPRRAGLALHLGAKLGVPSVGVTNRPLLAEGGWPPDVRGAVSPLRLGEETVGYWVRTRPGTRPLAVHAGWRTDPETAVRVVSSVLLRSRTPEPLRQARRIAREARAGRPPGGLVPPTCA